MEYLYIFWLVAALLLIVVEIFTTTFASVCFAIGAIASGIAAYFDASINWQLIIMAIFTFTSFVLVRPFILKFMSKKNGDIITNVDAIIGRIGRVSERIDPKAGTGRVAIDGDDWKAISTTGKIIEKGESVKVISHESLIIYVETIN